MKLTVITAVIAGLLSVAAYVPYGLDIMHGRVRPARATRVMLTLLIIIACGQQLALRAGFLTAVTLGEAAGSLAILGISLRKGIGGWRYTDIICYALLLLDLLVWLFICQPFAALCLSCAADVIGFWPTLYKTWRDPASETALFYILGVVAPGVSLLGSNHLTLAAGLYPLVLALENAMEVVLIKRRPKYQTIW